MPKSMAALNMDIAFSRSLHPFNSLTLQRTKLKPSHVRSTWGPKRFSPLQVKSVLSSFNSIIKKNNSKYSRSHKVYKYKSKKFALESIPKPELPVDNERGNTEKSRSDIANCVQPKELDGRTKEEFVWETNWYPVSVLEDLDPKKLTPFQLLGKDLVLWLDKDSVWRAFSDLCPHRLAPLSEGRIDENGWLQCSYHGWSFNGDGSCAIIPQASGKGPEMKAKDSPRACVLSYPTMESQGLLFVWPDPDSRELAQQTPPPRLPDSFDDPNWANITIQRDLMYGYDTLMENVSDPSHIHFAHHKVTGLRESAKPMPFRVAKSGIWGFEGSTESSVEPKFYSKFIAPCYVINKIELKSPPFFQNDTWIIWICSFNIPMGPGKTRSIVCSARNFFQILAPGKNWWQLTPRWYEHLKSNLVYDGDMIVLQGQEKALLRGDGNSPWNPKDYSKFTFTPTGADRLVLAFRNWLRRYGGGSPQYFSSSSNGLPLPSTVLSKREMLDRFSQHTEKCSSCRAALRNVRLFSMAAATCAVLLLGAASVPEDSFWRLGLATSGVISAFLGAFLKFSLEPKFIFVDYVHADIE